MLDGRLCDLVMAVKCQGLGKTLCLLLGIKKG